MQRILLLDDEPNVVSAIKRVLRAGFGPSPKGVSVAHCQRAPSKYVSPAAAPSESGLKIVGIAITRTSKSAHSRMPARRPMRNTHASRCTRWTRSTSGWT